MQLTNTIKPDLPEINKSEITIKQSYPKVKKEILKNKIEKIKNKEILATIFIIIEEHNSDVMKNATVNQNGVHMLFNNLSYETYVHLEKYLKKYERQRQQELSDMQTSDEYKHNIDNTCSEHQDYINSKLRYSNKEKMLIRRCEYEAVNTYS